MQYFKKKPSPLVSKVVIAVLSAGLVSGNSIAGEGEPTTYTDVSVPQLTGWNPINVHTLDGVTEATPKSHIYPTEAAKNDPLIGSVAAVFWQLDNGSGRSPGIQTVTDDFDFPTNNCIMASGEMEIAPGTIVPKTCSDAEGSSKRYFLEVTSSDVPVDMVFDLGVRDIRYKGVKDPSIDGGIELEEFSNTYGIGRIYRVIQKVINNTDERIASYRFELGTGIGDAFQPLSFEEHGVAFEMRSSVPREFFEGETGAPDIKVWNPQRFATISPKMYDDGSRERFNPGFLDHAPAGFLPPQFPPSGVGIEKSQYIDSGTAIVDGKIGSITSNYFDIINNQGAGATDPLVGNLLGYHLPDSLIPIVIGEYNTNEIGGESDAIVAIWDGYNWRSGRAGLDGDPEAVADNFAIIPNNQLTQWAAKPLGLNIAGEAEEDIVRYESLLSDDLSGLNTDVFIYISDKLLDDTGALKLDSITLRLTANSVKAVIGDVSGGEDPEWADGAPGSEAPELSSYMVADGVPIPLNDMGTTIGVDPLTINILANDLLDGQVLPDAVDPITGATVVITDNPNNGNVVIDPVTRLLTYTANQDYVGTEIIAYTVEVAGKTSTNSATVRIVVDPAPVPDAPVANNDSTTTFVGESVTLDVLVNDELKNDAEAAVVLTINNAPSNGTATVTGANSVVYTPNADFVGLERFTYILQVGNKFSNSALVSVRVDDPYVPPEANNDSGITLVGEPVTLDVLANDELNNDAPEAVVVLTIENPPLNGTATVTDANTIVYTSNDDFVGVDGFTYILQVDDKVSKSALVAVRVDEPVDSKMKSSSSGGCSVGSADSRFDPLLPGMLFFALAGLFLRRRKYSL